MSAQALVYDDLRETVRWLVERDARRENMLFLVNARLHEIERSTAELRALHGLDAPKPALGAQWVGLRQAAHLVDRSESTVRNWIGLHKIEARKVGGKTWMINAGSLPPRCGIAG
jgi:hypothetical protein